MTTITYGVPHSWLPAAPPTAFTAHRYDALGRLAGSTLPDGNRAERRYGPLTVEHWDAEDLAAGSPHAGTPRIERATALGVVEVEERLGAEAHLTRFERDALGRVARVVDAVGLVSTWHRDGLGRLDEIVHADAGRSTFTHDDAGNLRERRDARGALVTTEYDALGRPLQERLVDAAGVEEERVEYPLRRPLAPLPG